MTVRTMPINRSHAANPRRPSMRLRMGENIRIVAVAIQFRGGPLAEAGFLYYLLVFYPVTLVVETVLSLPPRERATDRRASFLPSPRVGEGRG